MKKKTRLLIVLASALALAVTLLLILLLGGSKWIKGGEDTPYPYAYQVRRDGTVRLRITEDTTGGYSWAVAEGETGAVEISAPAIRKDKTEFVVTPLLTGPSRFTLQHRRESALLDGDYVFDFFTNASSDLKLISLNGVGLVIEPPVKLSSPSGYQLLGVSPQDAQLTLQFSAPEEMRCAWTLETYDENIVSVDDQKTDDGGLTLQFTYINQGSTDLRVVARPVPEEGKPVGDLPGAVFTCKLSLDDTFFVVMEDESLEEFTGVMLPEREAKALAEAQDWLGRKLAVPEGTLLTWFSNSGSRGSETPLAIATFTTEEEEWTLVATVAEHSNAMYEDLTADLDETAQRENTTLASAAVELFLTEETGCAFWRDAGGVAWYLAGGAADTQTLKAMVEAVIAANT